MSGGLFSISTRVRPKGEALAWGVFGGIALLGWAATFGIRGDGLESGDWDEESGDGESEASEVGEDEEPRVGGYTELNGNGAVSLAK